MPIVFQALAAIADFPIAQCRNRPLVTGDEKDTPKMAEQQIRFDDGDAYERSMGVWSRLAGEVFLDWLAPSPALRWADIGCGSGAFTELLVQRCAPEKRKGSIRPKASLPSRALGPLRVLPNSSRVRRWRCLSPTPALMPP